MNTVLTMTNAAISEIGKNEEVVAKIKEINKIIPQEEEAKAMFFTEISEFLGEMVGVFPPRVNNGIYNCVESAVELIDWRYILKHFIGIEQKYQLDKDDSTWEDCTNILTYEMLGWIKSNPAVADNWRKTSEYWLSLEPEAEVPVLMRQWYEMEAKGSADSESSPLLKAAISCINWQEVAEEIS